LRICAGDGDSRKQGAGFIQAGLRVGEQRIGGALKTSTGQEEDLKLIGQARSGRLAAFEAIISKYHGFVKLKASSYFMSGGDADDLVQEGLIGLTKAIRDYRDDREASFRSFAELCITRQIITAIKTASRQKHTPLNSYLSLSHSPASHEDGECSLGDILPGSPVQDPLNQVISSEEVESLKDCLTRLLSMLETSVLRLYLEGRSYEQIAEKLGCDTKSVDNALQRIKRKVDLHLQSRQVYL
jgi:RNA polymerase sporulation-specific sigma factor